MKQLLYLSLTSWNAFDQRPHHFVRWYHNRTGMPVLWVDSYPTRLPKLSDLNRLLSRANTVVGSNSTEPWLKVISLGSLPVEPLPVLHKLNQLFWQKSLKVVSDFINTDNTLVVVTKPSKFALNVISNNKRVEVLYDIMDKYDAFYTGLSKYSIKKTEDQILQLAEHIWCSSSNLAMDYEQEGFKIQRVFNAVPSYEFPEKKQNQKTGVIGYVGAIGSWFDWEWVINLAKIASNYKIRLIGPVLVPIPRKLPQNVEFIPACNHRTALSHISFFDLGIIPFKKSQVTDAVDPIKYYEYISCGVPVLSSPFGEMISSHQYEKGVYLANKNTMNAELKKALAFKFPRGYREVFKIQNSWDQRFDQSGLLSQL